MLTHSWSVQVTLLHWELGQEQTRVESSVRTIGSV
jgi:hypothetical protein